ncbi:MAG: DUF1592 domain-containing protein [Planctomycetes bacterium]|nr:DUF1592 domain-containing protein [Planctomycetota bacterium]
MRRHNLPRPIAIAAVTLAAALGCVAAAALQGDTPALDLGAGYLKEIRPLLGKYCFACHSKKVHKGDLDLERFDSLAAIRKDTKPWQHMIEQLETGEMPPRGKPRPSDAERATLLRWVRAMLDAEARARTGDPGRVPLRRLSNAEYDCTIRDLTGVDMRPTREFPADGAAGEGFTNAAEALADVTPPLFTRYLNAAKDIAGRAVLLPDGFRFSPSKTRRDWTNESLEKLRQFYAAHSSDGRLAFAPYISATVRHRAALADGKFDDVATREKLNAKYLRSLWTTMTGGEPSQPLDRVRVRWRQGDIAAATREISDWQAALWKFVPIGSYRYGATTRQVANDPVAGDVQPVRLAVKPAPGQGEVVVRLVSHDLTPAARGTRIVWQRPRFEGKGKAPLLLADYPKYGSAFEVDHAAVFADAARYLAAAAELAHDAKPRVHDVARKHNLDAALLQRWTALLAIDARRETAEPALTAAATPLDLLDEKTPDNPQHPPIHGWRRRNAELPVLVSNASDAVRQIPGTMAPRKVAVHPTPTEFVAVAWKSPHAGKIKVAALVKHVHPACGNGVAWWLELRRGDRAAILAQGAIDLGGAAKVPEKTLTVAKGDQLVLVVDARNAEHTCDLTEVNFTITGAKKVWDLAADIANTVQAGNPHADTHGNKDTWSFVRGPAKPGNTIVAGRFPDASLLGQWRLAAGKGQRQESAALAERVQKLLTGPRPVQEKDPDRAVFDALIAPDGALLAGLDLARFARPRPRDAAFGLPGDRFTAEGNITALPNSSIEVRLPAPLFRDRDFVVEGRLDQPAGERVVFFDATAGTVPREPVWDGKSPIVASANSTAFKTLLKGFAEFRQIFPWYVCFPNVVPTDEVVSLKMFHREDEPLERLLLDAEQKRRLDHLWEEHRFISRQPVVENDYLPQFIGYVTQDQPKELLAYFESQRPVFKKRADEFNKDALAAEPKHLAELSRFAARAYRRPLHKQEEAELRGLYDKLRKKKVPHDEAFRGVLTRVLLTPAFLFRIEKAPAGVKPGPIDDWELASRLSYFLWSSMPDEELRRLAADGKLREPAVLAAQAQRMLKDDRLRALAIEFGTQWIHVRNFDELKEKNEKLFPTFTPALRKVIYEESILFFQDLFQADRAVTNILDSDYAFLNEALAKHYGIPGVTGPQWRRVEGVRKYGRGGVLGLASVQAKQAGASRTSPVLRGNWVVETLLGEKLPRPPANVPILPDVEGGADKRTTRQQVERHVSDASCASCHVRIDPYGFAFENFDAIGRWRTKEISGLPVDTRAKLKDGTEFAGIEGLRNHLLAKKKDVIVRLFCRQLLGYALGRATTLSDTTLIDEMVSELNRNDGRISAAVLTIVRSPQFRMVRGRDHDREE